MDIDMNILRALEREKEISFDILVEAIEQALLTAYSRSPGAQPRARVLLDRKTGHVTVLAAETDEEGDIVSGVIQQGRDPNDVMVDLGRLEALLPAGEQVPGERYQHGTRIRCMVI